MSAPKPLREESIPERAASLLRSAAFDVPPRAAAEKARLVAVVSASLPKPVRHTGLRELREGVSSGKWLSVLALLVVATGTVVVGAYYVSPAPRALPLPLPVPSEPVAPPPLAERAAIPVLPGPSPASPPESIDVTALPSASTEERPARANVHALPGTEHPVQAAATATAGAVEGVPRLEDELRAVDEARAAFVDQHPALALERVQSYRRRFPAGRFTAETDALEIEALAALGRKDEARSKAARFIADNPGSPYAQRVRSAVGLRE